MPFGGSLDFSIKLIIQRAGRRQRRRENRATLFGTRAGTSETRKAAKRAVTWPVRLAAALTVVWLPAEAASPVNAQTAPLRECLFVASYHEEDPWTRGVVQGFKRLSGRHCRTRTLYLDSKRRSSRTEIVARVDTVLAEIRRREPDVLIAADDVASKYLVVPHLRDSRIPVVFCGVNWTVSEYGYPFLNTTGMIEVAPIRELLEQVTTIVPGVRRGLFIGRDTLTADKNYRRVRDTAGEQRIEIVRWAATDLAQWRKAHERMDEYDFVYIDNPSGLPGWDAAEARRIARRHASRLSVSNLESAMPYAVLGMTKLPEEQGEWAAKVTIEVLNGTPVASIPIVPNIKYETLINHELLRELKLDIPQTLLMRAKTVDL